MRFRWDSVIQGFGLVLLPTAIFICAWTFFFQSFDSVVSSDCFLDPLLSAGSGASIGPGLGSHSFQWTGKITSSSRSRDGENSPSLSTFSIGSLGSTVGDNQQGSFLSFIDVRRMRKEGSDVDLVAFVVPNHIRQQCVGSPSECLQLSQIEPLSPPTNRSGQSVFRCYFLESDPSKGKSVYSVYRCSLSHYPVLQMYISMLFPVLRLTFFNFLKI